WVKVGSHFAQRWQAFFYHLEALHGLKRKDPCHRWLLHHLFLDLINADCLTFQQEWNCHPISGAGHDESPNDMRFLGMVQHRIYEDDCQGRSVEEIDRYYGVHGAERENLDSETGASHLADEDIPDIDSDDKLQDEEEDNRAYMPPVPVPKASCPFQTEEQLALFHRTLAMADVNNSIPQGMGLLPNEWGDDGYPSFEIIRSGRRGVKELHVALPDSIWRPRACRWGRALYIMSCIQDTMD
ncbi:hypothetical protein C8J56DRAFT_800752, partial [Mycena floridula]